MRKGKENTSTCSRKRETEYSDVSTLAISSKALIEEDVTMICVIRILISRSEESLNSRFIYHLHIVIVKAQPVVMAFHEADIVPVVGPNPNMNDDSEQGILRVGIFHGVAQFQLQREHNAVR